LESMMKMGGVGIDGSRLPPKISVRW